MQSPYGAGKVLFTIDILKPSCFFFCDDPWPWDGCDEDISISLQQSWEHIATVMETLCCFVFKERFLKSLN